MNAEQLVCSFDSFETDPKLCLWNGFGNVLFTFDRTLINLAQQCQIQHTRQGL